MGFSTVPCNEFVEVLASKAPASGRRRCFCAWSCAVGTALGKYGGKPDSSKREKICQDLGAEMQDA